MEVCADTIHKQLPTIDLNSAKELILKARKNKTTSFLKEFTRKEIEQLFISMCIALDIKNFDDEEDAYEDAEDGQFKAPDLTPVSTTVTKPLSDKGKGTPIDGEINDVNIVTNKNVINMKSKGVCRAYKQRVCSFGKKGEGCPFAHPPKCQTFCDFGLSKFNPNGCDQTKCNLLHPNLCKKAIKDGTCFKKDCKYHHFKGTKRTPPKTNTTNFNHQIPPKTNTTNINYPTPPKTNTTNFNYPPPVPPPQTLNSQQDTDKMTSFLLMEVGKLMEKLEKRVEDRLGSIFPHLQITPTQVSQLQPPPPPQFQHSQPPQTFRTPQVSQPQFFQPPAMYQHPNPP